jgi:hypothetical protein
MRAAYYDCRNESHAAAVARKCIAGSALTIIEPRPDGEYRIYVREDQQRALPKGSKLIDLEAQL